MIKFSTSYAPPKEGNGMYNGYGAFGGCDGCGGVDRAAYSAFYGGYPDNPRAGMSLLRSVSGFGDADDAPSRATWFVVGAAAVLLWPTITSLLSFIPRKAR